MKLGRLILYALLAVALVGCAGSKTAPSTGEKPKTFTIAMIAKSSQNPVFLSARTGAETSASEVSQKTGVEVTIDWRTPPTEDGEVQAQRIAQAVNDGADAILISCSDAAKVTAAINEAVAKDVPVMTFDSDAPNSKRFAFYGVDDIETGAMTMSELAKQTGGKAKVGILAGNPNAPNLQKRVQGAKDEAKKYPGIEVIDTFYHTETPQDAAQAVISAMKANPQIDAWCMIGGWALFTKTLLKDLDPAKVKVVSVDALPAELAYVDAGIAPVLLAQPTYDWGYVSVQKIAEKMINKKEVPVINKMKLVKVTKENLGEWARQLKEWGFGDVPKEYLNMK